MSPSIKEVSMTMVRNANRLLKGTRPMTPEQLNAVRDQTKHDKPQRPGNEEN